jgi:cell wall assembly regulator SMI1
VRDAIKERAGFERRAPRYAGYQESRPRDARISPGWYQPGWLPFATFGGATLVLLVDASPGPGGRVGQVIAFTHDPDEMTYVAPSFSEFLQASLQWLEARPQDLLEE